MYISSRFKFCQMQKLFVRLQWTSTGCYKKIRQDKEFSRSQDIWGHLDTPKNLHWNFKDFAHWGARQAENVYLASSSKSSHLVSRPFFPFLLKGNTFSLFPTQSHLASVRLHPGTVGSMLYCLQISLVVSAGPFSLLHVLQVELKPGEGSKLTLAGFKLSGAFTPAESTQQSP